jgi:hypothetical protein
MTIDRALLLYLLQQAEPHGLLTDVKLQQLAFLAELQMFGKRLKGLHFEFYRFAYGAFSKDLDNDLLSLRKKERVENFSVTEKAEEALKIVGEAIEEEETNHKVAEILQAVTQTYAPQDTGAITRSVEKVELILPEEPNKPTQSLPIGDVSFHSSLLVPARIEVDTEFQLTPQQHTRLNKALGY